MAAHFGGRHPRDRLATLRAHPPTLSADPLAGEPPDADGAGPGHAVELDPGSSAAVASGDVVAGDAAAAVPAAATGDVVAIGDAAPIGDAAATGDVVATEQGGGAVVGGRSAGRRAAGRLVRRWLPGDAADWRLDPGRRPAVWLAAVVLLAAVVAGAMVWRSRPVAEPAPALPAVEPAATDSAELVVSIAGLVARPGLVRLRPGARVADAVAAAGGPLPGTDLTGVNLARRLSDGEHVVVGPASAAAPQPGASPAAGGAASGQGGSGARLDLNTATMSDLDALPGVGPVTAQRILDWRAEHGRFATVDQLREVDGIGEARFAQLKDLVMA